MADFTWDEIPEEIYTSETLPEVQKRIFEMVPELLNGDEHAIIAKSAVGVRVYERKGHYSFDDLHQERNRSYSSVTDDLLLQVTIRISPEVGKELIAFAEREGELARDAERQEKLQAIDAQIAELQRQRDAL